MPQYPELETLMSGWFHQDFDLDGNTTLQQIIAAYCDVTPSDQRQALDAEIVRFLADAKDVAAEFQERFKPDIIPTAFAQTTREFLESIAALVRE